MDFSVIFQLRTKRFWWMDVIFYFVVAVFIATALCYFIFLVKNTIQRNDIKAETAKLETVGTGEQKDFENQVILYQKKIADFSNLFKNHEFASNVFVFIQNQTIPNVWFKQFSLDSKNRTVQLSGEADSMDAFSRQVAVFEKNKYVKNLATLNSAFGEAARVSFNLNLTLDPKIFTYVKDLNPILEPPAPAETTPVVTTTGEIVTAKSSEKTMIIFQILQPVQANGRIDLEKNTVTLEVPFGADITKLSPSITISPKAVVAPESGLAQNFTSPVVYKVTAEDGTSQDYMVTVNVLPKETKKTGSSVIAVVTVIILSILLIAGVIGGAFLIYKKRLSNKPQI